MVLSFKNFKEGWLGCLSIVGGSGFVWHMVAPGSHAVHFGVHKYKNTQIQKYTNMNCLEYMVAPGSRAVHFGVHKVLPNTDIHKYTNMICMYKYVTYGCHREQRHTLRIISSTVHFRPVSEAHKWDWYYNMFKCGHRWWCKERLFTMETELRHPDWQGHWPLSGET